MESGHKSQTQHNKCEGAREELPAGGTLLPFTDLPVFLVCRWVVCNFEMVEVDHLLHFVVVTPPLADDHRDVEQKDMPTETGRG